MFRRKLTEAQILRKEICFRIRLSQVFGETTVNTWLNTPNKTLDNKKPIHLIHNGDTQNLDRMIYVLESGEPLL